MIHVLDKETLRDPAQSLQDLDSLLKHKVKIDTNIIRLFNTHDSSCHHAFPRPDDTCPR